VPQFEPPPLSHRVVPIPSPRRYPTHNVKHERSNRDVGQGVGMFEEEKLGGYTDLETEL